MRGMVRIFEAEGEKGDPFRCARLPIPCEEVLPFLLFRQGAVDPGKRAPKRRPLLENVFQREIPRARSHDPRELPQPATGSRVAEDEMRIRQESPQENLPARQEQHTRSRAELTTELLEPFQSL